MRGVRAHSTDCGERQWGDAAQLGGEIADDVIEVGVGVSFGEEEVEFVARAARVFSQCVPCTRYHKFFFFCMKAGQIKRRSELVTLVRVLDDAVILPGTGSWALSGGRMVVGGARVYGHCGWGTGAKIWDGVEDGAVLPIRLRTRFCDGDLYRAGAGARGAGVDCGDYSGGDLGYCCFRQSALAFTDFRELKPSVWGKASTFAQ